MIIRDAEFSGHPARLTNYYGTEKCLFHSAVYIVIHSRVFTAEKL